MRNPAVLTVKQEGILKVLTSEIEIIETVSNHKAKIKAIWDTGATGTSVTSSVVKRLGLVPTGSAYVNTAAGLTIQNTYTVNITLSSGVTIFSVIVYEVPGLAGGCDALIGMDIITLGDMSITNHNGNTCMSFRIPSGHEIDFVKNPTYGITPISTPKKPGWLKPSSGTYARRDKKKKR